MNSLFDKLNLRPQERRLAVIVLVIAFVVANLFFVVPHFKDFGLQKKELEDLRKRLARGKSEIQKGPAYQKQLEALKKQGANVSSQSQFTELTKMVAEIARSSNIQYSGLPKVDLGGSEANEANAFFEERGIQIPLLENSKENVHKFLMNLTTNQAMIRIYGLDLRRTPNQMALTGTITVAGSFQKERTEPPPPDKKSPSTSKKS